uniref:glycosyltransferase n=1 Tax=Mycolicibacterium phlei TaxID=1771 RepID=UPI0037C90D23
MSAQHETMPAERPVRLAKPLEGKRILLIVENEAVPFDRRMWNMSRALRDFGAEVSVICPKYGPDNQSEEILEGVRIHRYDAVFSDGTTLGYVKEYLVALWHTLRLFHRMLLAGRRIHVVHVANPPDIFWPLAVYLRILGTRFIFDEHDLGPEAYLSKFDANG